METIATPSALRPLAPRAKVAIACFVVTCLLLLASIWHDFALLALFRRAGRGLATEAEGAALDRIGVPIAVGQVLALVVTAVTFCMWLHRSYANLSSAGVPRLKYTARRAVEGFFIPFVNLVRPYRVVMEVFGASGTLARGPAAPAAEGPGLEWLVGVWWLSMLLGNGLARVANARLRYATALGDYLGYAWQSFVADFVTLLAAVAIIAIIRMITGWQEGARAAQGAPPALTG